MACAIMSKYDRYGVDDASREMIPEQWMAGEYPGAQPQMEKWMRVSECNELWQKFLYQLRCSALTGCSPISSL